MYDIACRMAGFLASRTDLEDSRVDVVRFGLEIILGEFFKWIILLCAAAFLGILPGALFAMVSTAIFRMVSGGAHCEDYWRCLTFGMLVFLGFGKLGVYLGPFMIYREAVIFLVTGCLFLAVPVLIWAPGEVSNRKIATNEKGHFKRLTLFCLAAWTAVSALLVAPYSIPAAAAGFLAVVVQVFSFTPPGYWAIDRFDVVLSRLIGERRCSHA